MDGHPTSHSSQRALHDVMLLVVALVQGCATQSQVQVTAPALISGNALPIRLAPCSDRTNTKSHDVAAEATQLIKEKLRKTPSFELRDDAALILDCEVTQYIEGSAFKRWLMPGWGGTVGQISLMVSQAKDHSSIAIFHGNATVAAGGFYTIGAENYILKAAVDDVIANLRGWAESPAMHEKR